MLRFVLIAAAVFHAAPADACTCSAPGPACELMFQSTVFVGRVTNVVNESGAYAATTFEVTETLHSEVALGKTVTLHHMADGNMCGIAFAEGKTYVVYASGSAPDQLGAGACSRTHVATKNDPDIAFAHEKPTRDTALIEGTVVLSNAPKAGVEVRAAGTKVTAKSNAKGAFTLAVPPGKYELELTDPALRLWEGRKVEVTVPVAAACARRVLNVVWDGRIEGTVNSGGKPALVHAIAVRDSDRRGQLSARSDEQGHYLIHGVEAGAYFVGVSLPDYGGTVPSSPWPATYYPGTPDVKKARSVAVKQAGLTSGIDFALPPAFKVVAVRGRVLGANGRPVVGASVSIVPDGRNRSTSLSTLDGGTYSLTELAGERVVIRACDYGDREGPRCVDRTLTLADDVVVDLAIDAGR